MQDVSTELQFLSGVRVVDFTQFEAGPSCTEALAWLGADVVKIENPSSGDPGRSLGRTSPDADAVYFLQYNSNKRSAAINLKDPRGLELVKRLNLGSLRRASPPGPLKERAAAGCGRKGRRRSPAGRKSPPARQSALDPSANRHQNGPQPARVGFLGVSPGSPARG